jgi:hypothetical protein
MATVTTDEVKRPLREVVTVGGQTITLEMQESPVSNLGVLSGAEAFRVLNILDPVFAPANYNKADGSPLRLLDSVSAKVDLSKRSVEDMGFWHRNIDYHEVIICFSGALRWETEMGTVTLRRGDMMLIPKGISHRSMLCEESETENVLIELKLRDDLTYVGDKTT